MATEVTIETASTGRTDVYGMYHGEKFNAVSHLVGTVLGASGRDRSDCDGSDGGDSWKVVSVSIYGATLVVMYSSSTLYAQRARAEAKDVLRKMDHQSIYLLIAGSYTPFCLVTLRGPWGWSLFGVVWGLALLGGLQEIRPRNDARILSVVIYLLMGWVALVALVRWWHRPGPRRFRLGRGGRGCSTPLASSSMPSTLA